MSIVHGIKTLGVIGAGQMGTLFPAYQLVPEI